VGEGVGVEVAFKMICWFWCVKAILGIEKLALMGQCA